ncbi:MAG: ankyrin repeat domain-containing protein [Lentisphaerae bacterium]|nr:ankyrin repeat domain-containing protein [Lentisphaerota bacterium]
MLLVNRLVLVSGAEKAVRQGSLTKLQAIIRQHPQQLNRPNRKNGLTPLHWAVMEDRTDMVRWLLAQGADANARDRYGMTPLHKAAAFNRYTSASMLLEQGADPLAYGIKYGVMQLAPIHLAAEAGYSQLVQLLLERGVDINLPTAGQNQVTALHMAAAKGRSEVLELLLKSGAEVNARDSRLATPLRWARVAEQDEAAAMLRIYGGAE